MEKLGKEFLSFCNRANCCFDDFIILPPEGDVGIEEYIEYKANQIMSAKNIFSPREQHMLLLSYPSAETDNSRAFEFFFESPSVVALNDNFTGCFGIDVTEYLGKTEHPRFKELLTYIGSHTDIVFVLFVYTKDENLAKQMFNTLCSYDKFRKMSISLPSPETLCDYMAFEFEKLSFSMNSDTRAFLTEYFRNSPSGFDAADWLVLYLQNNSFDGTLSDLKALVEEAERLKTVTTVYPVKKIGF